MKSMEAKTSWIDGYYVMAIVLLATVRILDVEVMFIWLIPILFLPSVLKLRELGVTRRPSLDGEEPTMLGNERGSFLIATFFCTCLALNILWEIGKV